jgi:hypothetical protein
MMGNLAHFWSEENKAHRNLTVTIIPRVNVEWACFYKSEKKVPSPRNINLLVAESEND